MAEKVTEQSILGDIMKRPGGAEILKKYKFPCLTCPMASMEMGVLKLGDVTRMYGIDTEGVLAELNAGEE
jgi:hypothetical protein